MSKTVDNGMSIIRLMYFIESDESNDISVSEFIEELYTKKVGNWWELFKKRLV